MTGGDRAGFMQVAQTADAVYITPTLGACSATGAWVDFEVISSEAIIVGITAAGLINSSLITSASTYQQGFNIKCSKITKIELSTKLAVGVVIAHQKVLY